jgi:uncharacterized membrane protein
VPLGVSVPTTHLHEPVVRHSLRRYRIGVVASALVVGLGLTVLSPHAAVAAGLMAPFVQVGVAAALFVWARRPILDAKRSAGWYDDVPVRVSAQLTAGAVVGRGSRLWYAAALVVLLVTGIAGVALYGRQPDPYPTDWDGAGYPDAFTAKSVVSVFAATAVTLGVLILLAALNEVIPLLPVRKYPDGNPLGAERRRLAVRQGLQSGLGLLAVLITAGVAVLQITIWSGVTGAGLDAAGIGYVLLIMAAVLALLVRLIHANAVGLLPGGVAADGTSAASAGFQSPDDDDCWKAGLIYVNRDDPAILVPKRVGIGWTINFGRPGGVVLGVLTLVVIAAVVVVGSLQQH